MPFVLCAILTSSSSPTLQRGCSPLLHLLLDEFNVCTGNWFCKDLFCPGGLRRSSRTLCATCLHIHTCIVCVRWGADIVTVVFFAMCAPLTPDSTCAHLCTRVHRLCIQRPKRCVRGQCCRLITPVCTLYRWDVTPTVSFLPCIATRRPLTVFLLYRISVRVSPLCSPPLEPAGCCARSC